MKYRFLILALLAFTIVSCNKETEPITDEETADLVEATISSDENGVTSDIEYIAAKAVAEEDQYSSDCNWSGDSTFVLNLNGALRSYSLNFSYSWFVVCDGLIPTSINFNTSRSGEYSGPRLDYSGNAASALVMTDLLSGSAYTFNGTHDFAGSSTAQRVGETIQADFDLAVTFTNVQVNKLTLEVEGGTAEATLTASNDDASVTLAATVTFLGNGSATVVVNGNSYTISI